MNTPKYAVWMLSAGHLLNDFYYNFVPILLPLIMTRLDISLTLSGILVMVMSIASNLLQPVFGYIYDKHNFSKLLVPIIPFGAICICTIGYISTKVMLFIVIILTGLSVSGWHPLGSTLTVKTTPPEKRASMMSYYIAGGNLGYAVAPLIIVAFLAILPLEDLPLLIIPSLLIAIIYAKSGLTKISTVSDVPQKTSMRLIDMLKNASVLKINLSMGLRCWTHTSISTFLPLLIVTAGHSTFTSGLLLSWFLIGCTVGGLIGGWIGDHFSSHKRVIVWSMLIGFLPTYYFFTHPGTEPLSIIALFIAGACVLAPQPSSIVWTQNMLPANAGMASGMMMGFSFGLGSIGTAITAAVGDHIGLDNALLFTSFTMILGALFAISIPYKLKSKA